MANTCSNHKKSSKASPKIGRGILNDLRRGGFKHTLCQALKEIYHFYLDCETK